MLYWFYFSIKIIKWIYNLDDTLYSRKKKSLVTPQYDH